MLAESHKLTVWSLTQWLIFITIIGELQVQKKLSSATSAPTPSYPKRVNLSDSSPSNWALNMSKGEIDFFVEDSKAIQRHHEQDVVSSPKTVIKRR